MNEAVRSYLDTYLSISAETAPPADQIHGEIIRWKGAVWARQQSLRHWRQTLAGDEHLTAEQKAQSLDALTELENASRQLATISRAVPPPDRAEEYRAQIATLSSQIETLQRTLAQPAPTSAPRSSANRSTPPPSPRNSPLTPLWST